MNRYLIDLLTFADLLAACGVVHQEAVNDADAYDGCATMYRIADAYRRMKQEEES